MSLTLHVVGCVLLEPVLNYVLGPVDARLERDGLSASHTLSKFADLIVKVAADDLLVLLPVGPAKYIDTIIGEVEQAIFVKVSALIHIDGAGVDRRESVKVVGEELLLHSGETVEHLDGAL